MRWLISTTLLWTLGMGIHPAWASNSNIEALRQRFVVQRAASVQSMRAALREGSSKERADACDFIRETRDRIALPLVIGLLGDSDPRVQERAVQALRYTADASVTPALCTLLGGSSPPFLLRAVMAALGDLGDTGAVPLLEPYLSDPRESVRATVACSLSALGSKLAPEALRASLHSHLPLAARLAVIGLGNCADTESQACLASLAKSPDYPWSEEAGISLARGRLRREKDPALAADRLAEWARSAPSATALWAVEELADREGPEIPDRLAEIAAEGGPASERARWLLMVRFGLDTVASMPDASREKHEAPAHQAFFDASYALLEVGDCGAAALYDAAAYADIRSGCADEDLQDCDNQPCSMGDLCASANRHFYNPVTGGGLPHIPLYSCESGMQMTARQNALNHWDATLSAFAEDRLYGYNNAYHLLGQVMHLLQDVSVPAHAHVDNHLDSFGDDYEKWYEAYVLDWGAVALDGLDPWPSDGVSLGALVDSMAQVTYALAAYDGELVEDPDRQQDCLDHELGRMFSLAYFDGWFVDTRWELRDRNNALVGDYDPNPLVDLGDDEWWPAEGNFTESTVSGATHIRGKFYIENLSESNTRFQPKSFAAAKLRYSQFTPGQSLVEIYAHELVPECLRRCAALLAFFAQTVQPRPVRIVSPAPSEIVGGVTPVVVEVGEAFQPPVLWVNGQELAVAPVFDPPSTYRFLWNTGPLGVAAPCHVEARADALWTECTVSDTVDVVAGNQPPDEGEGVVEGEGVAEGEGLVEGLFEGEGVVEGEGIAEGEGTADGEGAIEGEGVAEGEGSVEGTAEGEPCANPRHAADQNGDAKIDLTELLRVVQFFNTGALHCAENETPTEDGYLPGFGSTEGCCMHSSDYAPADWQINLTELLRLIQFFNIDGYRACPASGSEDGFCPGD
jgi:hypothetical protein